MNTGRPPGHGGRLPGHRGRPLHPGHGGAPLGHGGCLPGHGRRDTGDAPRDTGGASRDTGDASRYTGGAPRDMAGTTQDTGGRYRSGCLAITLWSKKFIFALDCRMPNYAGLRPNWHICMKILIAYMQIFYASTSSIPCVVIECTDYRRHHTTCHIQYAVQHVCLHVPSPGGLLWGVSPRGGRGQ